MKKKVKRDVVREIPPAEFAAKLRRLADALEQGRRFEIRVAGERIHIPARAQFSIEHERRRKQRGGRVSGTLEQRLRLTLPQGIPDL